MTVSTNNPVATLINPKFRRILIQIVRNDMDVTDISQGLQKQSNVTDATCEAQTVTLPEHLSSSTVFSGVRVVQSFVFCVVFCTSLSFCSFLGGVILSVFLRFAV